MLINNLNNPQNITSLTSEALVKQKSLLQKIEPSSHKGVQDLRSESMNDIPKVNTDVNHDNKINRVVMYDYDDTLAPEYEVVATATAVLKELGIDDNAIKQHVNNDVFKEYDRNKSPMVKDLPSKIPALREKLLSIRQNPAFNDGLSDTQLGQHLFRMFMSRYHAMCVKPAFIDRNGALPLLQSQNKTGTMQTIVSNKPAFRLDRRLVTTPLRPFFSYVYGVETIQVNGKLTSRLKGKPQSDMLLEQLKDANIDRSAHVYFVDDKDGKQIDALDGIKSQGYTNRTYIHLDEDAAQSVEKLADNSAGTHIYKAKTLQDVQILLNQI